MLGVETFNQKMHSVIEILKNSGINGCITGSCLLDADFDSWSVKPDIDVFVYGERYMVEAICILRSRYGFEFGVDETERSKKQEKKKYGWLLKGKKNKKFKSLQTIKLNWDGIICNVSCKKFQNNVADVVNCFDMTLIMKGWDIPHGFMYDMTNQWCPSNMAIPNKLREVDEDILTTAYWIRQFDRVIKYWDRGYDTRPMARFYIQQIDEVLDQADTFTSDSYRSFFDEFAEEFIETKNRIVRWLEDKEDSND